MQSTLHHKGGTTTVSSDDWLATIKTMGKKAVIFDCDGTLADSTTAHFLCMQSAARDQGYDMTSEWYHRRSGLDRLSLFQDFQTNIAEGLNIDVAVQTSMAQFRTHVATVTPIHPTVQLLHQLVDEGYPVAVGTNAERPVAELTLRQIGVFDHLEGVACISDGFPAKPAPHMFEHAARLLNQEPADVAVFEDSTQGVEAALAASMAVFCLRACFKS